MGARAGLTCKILSTRQISFAAASRAMYVDRDRRAAVLGAASRFRWAQMFEGRSIEPAITSAA